MHDEIRFLQTGADALNIDARHISACYGNMTNHKEDSMEKLMLKIGAVFVSVLAFSFCAQAAGPEAFTVGERLTYSLRWEKVPAGEAILEVLPGSAPEGQKGLNFRVTAKTNGFVDIFYKVRDRIDSFTDPGVERSLLYLKNQREGSYKRDITVTFDWYRLLARYHNKVNGYKDPIRIMPGTYDPLSIFYGFRMQELAVGSVHRLPVTDGVKMIVGKAEVVGREVIEVPAGEFDCFKVIPELTHLGGVFKKSPDAKLEIWVTADERKIPVKISSKVVVGKFHAVLTEADLPQLELADDS